MKKTTMTKGLAFAATAIFGVTAAYAVEYTSDTDLSFSSSTMNDWLNVDIQNGGSATQSDTFERNWVFRTSADKSSRAELRRATTTNGGTEVIGGKFKLSSASEGAKISIIQVLNVNTVGQTSGSASPASQLILKQVSARSETWAFYVNQDQSSPCTSITITSADRVDVVMTYKSGSRPTFTITKNGSAQSCTKTGGNTVNVGDGGRNYYGKLGGYTTSSGAGSSVVSWTSIYD